jgi:outer membrane receptor protein involved in Fe transport
LLFVLVVYCQTTGKLKGYVTDENGDPLPGANVTVIGTTYGGETDTSGYFFIIGVRAGTYDLKAEFVGYRSKEAKGIKVKAGLSTSQNFKLSGEEIELEAIGVEVVTEQKVEKDVTTSMRNIDVGNIDKLAITHVEELLKTTAGVKTDSEGELHFRGGRSGEVNYIIDGIMIGDPTGAKTNPIEINFANVESFNIMKGVPDAEYGDALSGSVNIILKAGDQEKTGGHIKYETDFFTGKSTLNYDRGEFSLSGPIPFSINGNKPTYYIGTELTVQDGFAESYRIKGNPDGEYFKFKDHDLTGLGFEIPQRRENTFNLILKGAYDLNPTMKLSVSYMKSREHGIEYDYYYRYTPETAAETISDVSVLNITWRHNINRNSYYDLIFSRYNRQYESLPGGKDPGDFVMSDSMDRFNVNYDDPPRNNDVKRNGVRDGGEAEGYTDTNQNGYFDREYYENNSGSGICDTDAGDVFKPFDPAYDANMNGVWDGDALFDSNGNNAWDHWEKGTSYTGFSGDCLYGEIVEGYSDNNMSGKYEADLYSPEGEFPGTDEPYVDGDTFNDTGEPFIDQRKFCNAKVNDEEIITELPNGKWDPETTTKLKIYTLRVNTELGIEEIHKDLRRSDFYERVNHHITSPFYRADTLYSRSSTGKTVVINSVTYDLVDQYINFTYKEEDFANLKSSLGSTTQDIPRINNIYNGAEDKIFDEFEAYCSYRPYGSSTNENELGWRVNADYYEYVGTYSVFKAPKNLYDELPNLRDITHNEFCTWINRNPDTNQTYDSPDGSYDTGEEFTDYNYDNAWNKNTGFLLKGQYLDGITYSLFDNTVTKLKGTYTNQIDKFHMVKSGFELVLNDFDYYSVINPYTTYNTEMYEVADGDPYPERGREKTVYSYQPKEFSSFVQDKMEFEDLVVNAGLRLDMRILDDKAVNVYEEKYGEGLPGYEDEIDQIKAVVSPRFGISHSISENSKLFFSYGHLYQLPQYTLVFDTNTKAVSNPLFGNMNLGYERNVQYELGVVNQFGDYLLDITGYFKDIYDMINTKTYTSTITDDATVFTNSDYGKSRGIELTVDKALKNNYLWSFSYTFSYAYGKSSTQTSNIYDDELVIKEFPLDWDERHTINSYFALVFGPGQTIKGVPYTDDWTLSISTEFGSGKPFTPSVDYYSGDIDPKKIVTNSERLPWTSNTDVKFTKNFGKLRFDLSIFNMFNKINVESVYSDTGTWNTRSSAFYENEENSNLIEIFRNPANIAERRNYRLGVSYLW